MSDEERERYKDIDFDLEYFKKTSVSSANTYDDKEQTLMHMWRFPSLTLHGVEGAFSGPGVKTVIPATVKGKFSIRLVPHQAPAQVIKQVIEHVEKEFAKLKSRCTLKVVTHRGDTAWVTDSTFPPRLKCLKSLYLTKNHLSEPLQLCGCIQRPGKGLGHEPRLHS